MSSTQAPAMTEPWNGPGNQDGILTEVLPHHNARHPNASRLAFEHWYFDARLDNGLIVVGFLTKRRPEDLPLSRPWAEITVYYPDGTHRQISQRYPAKATYFSAEKCSVRVGSNHADVDFSGELPCYQVHFEEQDVVLDLKFQNEVPPWLPGKGENHFHKGEVFGWCVGAPRARVSGTVSIDGERSEVTGIGYADHNWGVGDMRKVIDKWHWGRLYADEYTLLYAVVATQEAYGSTQIKPVMLARGGKIIASTGEAVFTEGPTQFNTDAGRNYPTWISLDIPGVFSVKLDVDEVLQGESLLEAIPVVGSPLLRPLMRKLVGNPGYFRFSSHFELSVPREDGSSDVLTGTTLHELVALR